MYLSRAPNNFHKFEKSHKNLGKYIYHTLYTEGIWEKWSTLKHFIYFGGHVK